MPSRIETEKGNAARMRSSRPPQSVPSVAAADAVDLAALRDAAAGCRGCPLWAHATQTVFGEGPAPAPVMLVGEQPGDQEDRSGRPFVGPAGRMLDRALAQAGIARDRVYVTNAVKHFKFALRGKRRLHQKPVEAEIAACHAWLERELELVAPVLVVALGATAARALTGRAMAIERNRGRVLPFMAGRRLLITVHPSYLLRVPDEARAQAYARFVQDIALARPFATPAH